MASNNSARDTLTATAETQALVLHHTKGECAQSLSAAFPATGDSPEKTSDNFHTPAHHADAAGFIGQS